MVLLVGVSQLVPFLSQGFKTLESCLVALTVVRLKNFIELVYLSLLFRRGVIRKILGAFVHE